MYLEETTKYYETEKQKDFKADFLDETKAEIHTLAKFQNYCYASFEVPDFLPISIETSKIDGLKDHGNKSFEQKGLYKISAILWLESSM